MSCVLLLTHRGIIASADYALSLVEVGRRENLIDPSFPFPRHLAAGSMCCASYRPVTVCSLPGAARRQVCPSSSFSSGWLLSWGWSTVVWSSSLWAEPAKSMGLIMGKGIIQHEQSWQLLVWHMENALLAGWSLFNTVQPHPSSHSKICHPCAYEVAPYLWQDLTPSNPKLTRFVSHIFSHLKAKQPIQIGILATSYSHCKKILSPKRWILTTYLKCLL